MCEGPDIHCGYGKLLRAIHAAILLQATRHGPWYDVFRFNLWHIDQGIVNIFGSGSS